MTVPFNLIKDDKAALPHNECVLYKHQNGCSENTQLVTSLTNGWRKQDYIRLLYLW